ncbi:peptide chain release factor family protein [Bythopirellula goksoeyrii]|uniref:Peptide chain release factor 1 n=1 Tax=Bythopirellula goksoeyrii TaxID=1400387 RepID=A0A5B9QLY5_9BACT|nr:peptide chain release factor-like protein [Bythopirellula goksoeyrii]QEG35171.1 Peptide chain release factor 1 [Bythopirellula goksoeyrii]
MVHPAQLPIEDLLVQCKFRRTRRSGPGGQHRNKVETAVVIEHLPTQVRAEGSERRSQSLNREVAIHRLRTQLALQLRTPASESSCNAPPSQLWKSRVSGGKVSVNVAHADFPSLLSEALDILASNAYEISPSADRLGITNSQLVKFLKLEPAALLAVNRHRSERDMPALR